MQVCDMCLTELNPFNGNIVKLNADKITEENIIICSKCNRKLAKYIHFEQKKNKRKGGVK